MGLHSRSLQSQCQPVALLEIPMTKSTTESLHQGTRHKLLCIWLWIEFVLLYGLVPPLVAGLVRPHRGDAILESLDIDWFSFETGLPGGIFIFPLLLFTFFSMLMFLRLDPSFDNRKLWNGAGFRREIRRILIVFAICGPIVLLATWFLAYHTVLLPERGFLRLPRELPLLMLLIALFYPWLSAYPQEITHRAFFFHRYKPIIGSGISAFVLNVIAFSWLHAPMWNWIAFAMTIPGGILFARTYRRSDSALAAGFEHAIYGIWVFFVGLGYFVFAGNMSGG